MTQKVSSDLLQELERQTQTLLTLGYPALAHISDDTFRQHLAPLKEKLKDSSIEHTAGHIPVIIAISHTLVTPEQAMPLVKVKNTPGSVNMYPTKPSAFTPIEGVTIPTNPVYLLLDVDPGRDLQNIAPADALPLIHQRGRSPLTIDEGVAIVTHVPEVLQSKIYTCFSMLGSRQGDKRVPALWMSYGKPRLGWCWDGNPHTWLGSASCARRLSA